MEGLSVQQCGHTQSSGVSKGLSQSSRCVNPFDTRLGLAVFEQPHDCNFRLSHSKDVFWTPNERIIAMRSPTTALEPNGCIVVSLDRKCLGAGWLVRERCSEAFSIRGLEGRRWQWRALLWS